MPPGDEAAVALPPSSDCSLGICTFSLGLFAPCPSPAMLENDWPRIGCGGRWAFAGGGVGIDGLLRCTVPTSIDWDRLSFSTLMWSCRDSAVVVPIPQC